MGNEAISSRPLHDRLEGLYALIQQPLDASAKILQEALTSQSPFVDRLARHGFRLGGKRVRPALLLLAARAIGEIGPRHIVLAAAVEMIHTATLVHDDVLDEASLRRHLATVNARWDNEASVLLGDFLFAKALCLASSIEAPTYACRLISGATLRMCEGELLQIGSRGDFDLSEDDYVRIIEGKTAALMECCCRLGGYYAFPSPPCANSVSERFASAMPIGDTTSKSQDDGLENGRCSRGISASSSQAMSTKATLADGNGAALVDDADGDSAQATLDAIGRYGRKLGIAFQIIDDILDVRGDEEKVGKSLGTDLVKQKATLPLIRLLNTGSEQRRRDVMSILQKEGNHKQEALAPLLLESGALDYARARAVQAVEDAKSSLSNLPATPGRAAMEEVADYVIERQR